VNSSPVFLVGWDGFIGTHLASWLRSSMPAADLEGCGLGDLDLEDAEAWKTLSGLLKPGSRVVVLAGIKRQAGDSYGAFEKNMRIAVSVARAIERARPARGIFFSSAPGYGGETENTAITETTPVDPVSCYGIAKFASERLLANAARAASSSIVLLRPPLIYGPGDTTDSYGPVGFCRAAARGRPITLWGDGSELREFLYVGDCCRLVAGLLDMAWEGVLNAASGRSHTFREIIASVQRVSGKKPEVLQKPRTKGKVDNAFDASLLHSVLPGFSFTDLDAGIRATLEQEAAHG
jgi:UDP-glucose 4-epimerase